MTKFWKLFFSSFIVLIFVGFLAWGFYQNNRDQAMAQDFMGETQIICEEPIPVGLAIDQAISFLNDIYETYQGDTIKTAKDQVNDLVAIVNANGNGNVCDFNECKAQVATGGPKASIEVKALPFLPGKAEYGYTVPTCNIKEGVGNPCPSLGGFLKKGPTNPVVLEDFQNILISQADNIHLLFEGKNQDIPANLAQDGEVAGITKTSKADLVYRYVDSVEKDWFTPNPQSNTCALSELEKTRIKQGLMGEKYPLSCLSALAQGIYSPKPWSEVCQKECADNKLSDDCRACLARCDGESVYATLNCKMYSAGNKASEPQRCSECKNEETGVCDADECNSGNWGADCVWGKQYSVSAANTCYQKIKEAGTSDKCSTMKGQSKRCCGDKCANGVNSECYECLCDGLTKEQCLDWVCGGSKSNWVCCHEEPIQNPAFYIVNQIFDIGEYVESYTSPNGEKVFRISSGKKLTFGEAYGLALKITQSYVPEIDLAFLLGNLYKEARFLAEAGQCKAGDIATNITPPDKVALKEIATELGLDFDKLPLSCAEKIGSGGAMGPAQFMPTTWLNAENNTGYKFLVENITKEKPANPWDFRDAFLAAALLLRDNGAKKGDENSEKAAAAQYYSGSKTKTNNYSVWAAMCFKKGFQELIAAGCLDEMGPKISICQNSEKNLNRACSKTQYTLNKALDTIIFWK